MTQTICLSVGRGGANAAGDIRVVQVLLNARREEIKPTPVLAEDGLIGPKTIAAIEEFQRRVVKLSHPDGRVDPGGKTWRALTASVAKVERPPNLTAQFEAVSREGQTRQMMAGRITVNNHTYDFRSGGHGRGNLPPGTYVVTAHRWDRSETGFSVDGVGYSFALNDAFDTRVGQTRTLLRIHPDGGVVGTNGCIGIVGNGQTQQAFREDMRTELNRGQGSVSLTVRGR